MEKLQQALQKARNSRQTLETGVQAATIDARRVYWSELEPLAVQKKTLIRNHIVSQDATSAATPFDVLRTKVLLQMRKNDWKRMAITSPTAGCGKSLIACNLAFSLARQPDIRAVVIELDLHRPSMIRMLGVEPKRDVTEMITGQVSFQEQALRLRENVAISLAKGAVRDPAQFLLSQETSDTLKGIETRYRPDIIIFDLPPILQGDYTRAFLRNADCALMIARAEKTKVKDIDDCEREIAENTNVLGVVLNQNRFSGESSYTYGAS